MLKAHSYLSFPSGSILCFFVGVFWLTSAQAQQDANRRTDWFGGLGAYEFCLRQIDIDAEEAFDRSLLWRDQGGGAPAIHCSALALMALSQYADAADRLDALAQDPSNGLDGALRAEIFLQAANGWMLEGFPLQAVQSLNAAQRLAADDADLAEQINFDRARAFIMDNDWDAAIGQLSLVLNQNPASKDALTLRATGYRALGEGALALEDLGRVLGGDPDYVPALLERGVLWRLLGEDEAARADWIRVLLLDGEGELADAARRQLHNLDFPEGL